MIIGIGYKAGTGKDTIAAHLVAAHGYRRFSFADTLRDMCSVMFQWTHHDMLDRETKEQSDGRWPFTRRQGVQRMGDAVRREFGDDILVRAAEPILRSDLDIVIPDVRKRVEVDTIKAAGGQVWLVTRPDVKTVSAHVTETELDGYRDWDFEIINNSTIENMLVIVDCIMRTPKSDRTNVELAKAIVRKAMANDASNYKEKK